MIQTNLVRTGGKGRAWPRREGSRHGWVCACVLVTGLWLAVFEAGVATADPSPACRNLAMWFGTRPAELDTNSLTALGTCVMEEIQARAASQEPTPPPEAQGDSPPSQGPPPEETGWGPWAAPPPWSDDQSKPTPWDSYDK